MTNETTQQLDYDGLIGSLRDSARITSKQTGLREDVLLDTKAADAITALRAERDEIRIGRKSLHDIIESYRDRLIELDKERNALKADLERVKKDANRMRSALKHLSEIQGHTDKVACLHIIDGVTKVARAAMTPEEGD